MPIYRCAVNIAYPAPGAPGVNIWHVSTGSTATPEAVAVQMAVVQAFYTAIRNFYPTSVTLTWDGLSTDVVTGDQVQSPAWTVLGGTTASYAPLATALCVSWRTGTAQRSGIGRTFVGPLVSSVVDNDGTPVGTSLATFRTAANNLVTQAIAARTEEGLGLGVYSRTTGALRPFTAARVRDQFAVLRSRRD